MTSQARTSWNKDLFTGALLASGWRIWRLYRREFFALFPPATVSWLLETGDRKLVVRAGDGAPKFHFQGGPPEGNLLPLGPQEARKMSLSQALAQRGLSRAGTKVFLEIPREAFFVRRFDIPA